MHKAEIRANSGGDVVGLTRTAVVTDESPSCSIPCGWTFDCWTCGMLQCFETRKRPEPETECYVNRRRGVGVWCTQRRGLTIDGSYRSAPSGRLPILSKRRMKRERMLRTLLTAMPGGCSLVLPSLLTRSTNRLACLLRGIDLFLDSWVVVCDGS